MPERVRKTDPNFKLKIISLLLAIVIWYMINYFSDPAIRMTVSNVKVQIQHEDFLESRGEICTVLDNTDVIPIVTLQAKRSVIDKLDAGNIVATADVRDMEDDGSVRIVLSTNKYNSSIERISGSIGSVQLQVEPLETKALTLEIETEGAPADGYVLMDTSAEQNQINLSGPESYVNEVARATVLVDISGSEKTIHSYPEIVLYDQEGNIITADDLEAHRLRLNVSSVKVTAEIYPTKEITVTCGSEVPLADGYELEYEPTVDPSVVLAAGPAGILRETDSIVIPAEDIASEPVGKNIHKLVNIRGYLPDGLSVVEPADATVSVHLQVTRKEEEETEETEESDAAGTAETAETAEAAAEQESEDAQ